MLAKLLYLVELNYSFFFQRCMTTIFDFSPVEKEIERFANGDKNYYLNRTNKNTAMLHFALMLWKRGDESYITFVSKLTSYYQKVFNLKVKYMEEEIETIFDHNITKEEENQFLKKELYLLVTKDKDTANADIAYLYWYRNNRPKMEEYAAKIKDINYRNDFWRTVNHPW